MVALSFLCLSLPRFDLLRIFGSLSFSRRKSMASVSQTWIAPTSLFSSSRKSSATRSVISNLKSVSLPVNGKSFSNLRVHVPRGRLQICCAAKPETVVKVCDIVRKQLALPDDSAVSGESKFASLGADSLDTVEIVMGLEEEFGISVEEESAQSIATVQDAADLIEMLIEKKGA